MRMQRIPEFLSTVPGFNVLKNRNRTVRRLTRRTSGNIWPGWFSSTDAGWVKGCWTTAPGRTLNPSPPSGSEHEAARSPADQRFHGEPNQNWLIDLSWHWLEFTWNYLWRDHLPWFFLWRFVGYWTFYFVNSIILLIHIHAIKTKLQEPVCSCCCRLFDIRSVARPSTCNVF